jgi:hypothetical protein
MKKNTIINSAVGLFGIAAVAGLALSVTSYVDSYQKIHASERGERVTEKMREIVLLNDLVHRLNENQVETAKVRLSEALETRLAGLDSIKDTSDELTGSMAQFLIGQIAHTRKLHPEYYPTMVQPAAPVTTKVAQIADH